MKLTRHEIITHLTKCMFHFWLIPSIEVDWEHFSTRDYGDNKWLHLYFRWLFWSVDIEWEE